MMIEKNVKKEEALKRMKILGLSEEVISQFENECAVCIHDPQRVNVILHGKVHDIQWSEIRPVTEEEHQQIRNFESEYNCLVYAAIKNYTSIGTMNSYFYVSDYSEEWDNDQEILRESGTYAFVYNESEPMFSEIGYIGFERREKCGFQSYLVRTE